ncbi:MAG TPA: M56 family metallopeptidase, partial [Gemmatimonadaceae bacterium]|nr:M56 family metallopeptidase [Gemmatimonadaceae bacterium]
ASATRLHRHRRRWRESLLDGIPVYVSHDVGPALFGFTRFGIVVPAWVAELEAVRPRLILAHEREHARAGDPITLLAGALLVLVQPLNPAAWMMYRRLRLAIEIDCDGRVLAHAPDVRTYGDLLLDVGERTLPGAAPIAALSEGGSHLARRITAMSPSPARTGTARIAAASLLSAALVIGAWWMPHPVAAAQEPTAQPSPRRTNASATRAIVRVHSIGLRNASATPQVLVWGQDGPIRVAVGDGELRTVSDTLRFDRLPSMRIDVTDGHAFVRLVGGGAMMLAASLEDDPAKRFTAATAQVAFLRGGRRVSNGDTASPHIVDFGARPFVSVSDDLLRRLVGERFPRLLAGPVGPEPYVWLLIDGHDRLIESNRGLGDLPRTADGRLGSLRSSAVRRMLPGMAPSLRDGEAWGWRKLRTTAGDSLNVIWVRQLSAP